MLVACLVAWLVLTSVIVWAGSSAASLRITCEGIEDAPCRAAVAAVLERGLPAVHPLLLEASVMPGPAFPRAIGQRATVHFDLAGVPGPTTVRLYYDIGAHWGGTSDRGAVDLAAWAIGWAALVAAVVVVLIAAGVRRARSRDVSRIRGAAGP